MKIKNKILIFIVIVLLVLLVFPLLIVNYQESRDVMSSLLIMFFVVNPITSILLGVLSGKNISKLWWMPISFTILFPLLYVFALKELVIDLYIYSLGYLILGLVSMVVTYYLTKGKK